MSNLPITQVIMPNLTRVYQHLFAILVIGLGLISLTGCVTPILRHSLQAQAYYQQGFKYETGMGVPKNIEEARKWYQLSAQLGNPSAQIGLARLDQVLVQRGVAQNIPAASPALQNVSSTYVDKTQHDIKTETVQGGENYLLGVRYESGIGVPKSIEEAKRYYRLSADQGNALAKARLQELGEEVIKNNDPASQAVTIDSPGKSIRQTIHVPITEFSQKKVGQGIGKSLSSTLQADPVSDLVEKRMSEYGSRSDVVMVIFEAKKDPDFALANIKAAMKTRDPNGIMNPYWIIGVGDEKTSTKTNCGVIVGQWYARGFPYRASWEQIVYRSLQEHAKSGTYLYTQDGEFKVTNEGRSQSDTLKKNCFRGSKIAQSNFNTFIARTVRDPATDLLLIGAGVILFPSLISGGGSTNYDDSGTEIERIKEENFRQRLEDKAKKRELERRYQEGYVNP